jgi:hypothetical protein
MTTLNENQHWVPKFLVKNFADKDGRVFCLDVQTDQVTKRPPKYVASDSAFNEFSVDGEVISYEEKLERIETAAAPILAKIVSTGAIGPLTEAQRDKLSDFLAAQSFRTEAFYKGLRFKGTRREFGQTFAQLWRSAFIVSAEIKRRIWTLMTIEHDDVFYLGDHPIVLQHSDSDEKGSEVGFDIKGVEALMPLSPRQALYMPCIATSRQIIAGYETAQRAPETIRLARSRGVSMPSEMQKFQELSRRILVKQSPLYEALTAGKPIVVSPENVQNLNYLQCAWAHAAIYSNRGDFTFAKHVFRNTPQYRSVPETRLGAIGPA